jgi:dienelactone hydrolase
LRSNTNGRRLRIKCWYPAEPEANARPELVWADLRSRRSVPLPVRALLACMRQRSSTYPNAPLQRDVRGSRLVLYNHGLVSFAAENTSLAEALASHGFTVLAIEHEGQLLERNALGAEQSSEQKRADARLTAALGKAQGAERARLASEYYAASTATNRIVVERAADTVYVLDHVSAVLERIPGREPESIDTRSAHLVGFSVGGAVATETAKRDRRAASVVNLDGGMQGTQGPAAIEVPYLMMYSAANEGMNDALLPSHAQCLAPLGTTHLNYHDVAVLVPGLRLVGAIGRTSPRSFLRQRNRAVVGFCRTQRALDPG